jgi:hypothetical protein
MPGPTNTTDATATQITSVPAIITQDVFDTTAPEYEGSTTADRSLTSRKTRVWRRSKMRAYPSAWQRAAVTSASSSCRPASNSTSGSSSPGSVKNKWMVPTWTANNP